MTEQEKDVIYALVNAWDAFLQLPSEHSDDYLEFRQAIHSAQKTVLARPARRELNNETVR